MTELIKIDRISFEDEGNQILKEINLSIAEGEFLAVAGPSGSGKSTLLKVIASLLEPTSGTIYYKQKPLDQLDPPEYRKEVSYCFQTAQLFGETVRDNLAFPYEIRQQEFDETRAYDLLELVSLPKDYLNKSIQTLSGGEKQRVALIRSMMIPPQVLLLDEITSALDQESRQTIWDWIKYIRANSSTTIVMVSHNPEEVKLANKEIYIDKGQISQAGGLV